MVECVRSDAANGGRRRLVTTSRVHLPQVLNPGRFSVWVHRIPEFSLSESTTGYYGSMKTTIDIPEGELRDAMRFTRATTKREAVVKVLEEFNRRRRMAELVKYSGTFSDRFPTNDEIEAIDAKRDRDLNARSRR